MSDDRTPPERVRVGKLQEVQVPDVVKIDHACAAMYHAVGFDAAEVPVRSYADLANLTRDHNVFVVEADWKPAGYAAWRDEVPGVAYIEEMNVDPELQRFGLGSKLLEAVRDDARRHGIKHIVLRAWTKAKWAMGFYRKNGFRDTETATLPDDVMGWVTRKEQSGRPVVRPGETILFGEVGEAPPPPPEEPEESDVPPDDMG
ncbi:MAG: GNAT family N-acetyltransferase [Polyangiaceae bacterium]|nr:GNAT family N-acetyltransferase [Polyangiaceae bacterium]